MRKPAAARPPGGFGQAGLHGPLSHPGLGLVLAAGSFQIDDFIVGAGEIVASRYGDRLWPATTIGGTPCTISSVSPSDWSEDGILQLATAAGAANTGSVLAFPATPSLYRIPPPGSIWCCKVQLTAAVANYELWSGFASAAARVGATDATQFIGVRSGGGNLLGVVKDGASSETTVNLGYDCETVWRTFGFEVGGTTAAPSVQFFVLDEKGTAREAYDRTDIGDPITTTMPSTTLCPVAIGFVTTNATAKTVQIDHWCRGGRTARG